MDLEGDPWATMAVMVPIEVGPCLGHHPLVFNVIGVSLMKTWLKVDSCCGTHQWT